VSQVLYELELIDDLVPGSRFELLGHQYIRIDPVGYLYVDALTFKAVELSTGKARAIPWGTYVIKENTSG
jgi:hypothetical protein